MVYEVVYEDEYWWIAKDGVIIRDFCFIDPISPKRVIEEIKDEV